MNNIILDSVAAIKSSKCETYIWGGGPVAKRTAIWYENNGIAIKGFLIGQDYYSEGEIIGGRQTFCLETFISNLDREINVIYCIGRNLKYEINLIDSDRIKNFIIADFSAAFAIEDAELNVWDNSFWYSNKNAIMDIRNGFFDEESKKAFDEWIYQKRTSINWKPYSNQTQYFEPGVIKFHENETFVDVGGYEGETTIEFFKQSQNISNTSAIILEPEKANCDIIKEAFSRKTNIKIMPYGAWSKYQKIAISSDGSNSTLGHGDGFVECDTLDHLLKDEYPTYIKMDIEGAELEALKGAEKTIKRATPKIAVCVYHKKKDVINIIEFLKGIVPTYNYFFRSYRSEGIEAVLYAIPSSDNTNENN